MTRSLYGARPVPVNGIAPVHWAAPTMDASEYPQLSASVPRATIPRVPHDHSEVVRMALRPLRQWATAPIVGVEGGAGRTTVTRLLGRAFAAVRKGKVVAIDAVPLWGGLTAAIANTSSWTVEDIAAMTWPPTVPVDHLLESSFSADGPIPTVTTYAPERVSWVDDEARLVAVGRVSALVDLTLVDTVADPLSRSSLSLIMTARTTPVWVCSATRGGLWGVGEAISFFERLGAENLVQRSVIAAVGRSRGWPAEAAAAEAQLTGRGLEILRVPCSKDPLHDRKCLHAGVRILAATVARCG